MTTYTCSSESCDDVSGKIEAESPQKAAEQYTAEYLDFDPSDPQSLIEVRVKYLDSDGIEQVEYFDIVIELSWTPKVWNY